MAEILKSGGLTRRHTSPTLLAVLFSLSVFPPGAPIRAAQLNEAQITRIIKSVDMLPEQAEVRPAVLKDTVRGGTAVRTGTESRTELTFADQTLTRLGANTTFSFNEGSRNVDLGTGVMLFYAPKNSGGAKISTAAVTAAITGTTVLIEAHAGKQKSADGRSAQDEDSAGAQFGLVTRKTKPANKKGQNGYFKFISLEGIASVFLNSNPGESVAIHPGEMLIVPANATKLPKTVKVDLKKLVASCLLITDFAPLASEPLIAQEIAKQESEQAEAEPPVNTDPTSIDVIDQTFSAIPPLPTTTPPGPPVGTTIVYLGLAAGNWSSTASWNPAIIPNNGGGNTYTAIINSGMLTQDIAPGVTIQQLQMTSGTLVLTNPLTLNAGLQFTGGTFIGGNLSIGGASTQSASMTLQNVTLSNTGTYDITFASGFAFSASGSNFINSGTLRKTDTGFEEVFFNIPIDNTGTVSVSNGAFTFTAGGTNSGIFSAAAGGFLRLDSSFTFDAASNVTGAGSFDFLSGTTDIAGGYNVTGRSNFSGATVNFNSPITSLGAVTINSGAVNFNSTAVTASSIDLINGTLGGTAPNVNSTGLLTWSGGTISGVGAINANGGILLDNAQVFLNQRALNNALGQTATMSNFSEILFQNGAVINNNGLFLVQTNTAADGFFYNSGADGVFNNNGTFTRNTGATSFVVTPQIAFNNAGTVNANSGTLVFNGGYTQTAGTTQLGGGDISSTGALQIQGGLLTGSGNIFAAINSNATIRPALGGSGLNVTGNVALMSSSNLSFQIGGLIQGNQYGFLGVNGMVALSGNLVLSFANGFQNSVTAGDAFTISTASGGITGIFANVASGARLDTSDGFGSFQVDYTGTNLVLSNFLPPAAIAATWTGTTGNWSDPAQWNINPNFPNNGQPGAGDRYDATLNNGGTITLDIPVTIENFTLSNGTVTGAGTLTINQLFNWGGGTLAGGAVVNANGGILFSNGNAIIQGGTTVNNAVGQTATLNAAGAALVLLGPAETFNNNGTFLAQNDRGVLHGAGTSTFNNAGTFTRDTSAGTFTIAFGVNFNNTGTVNVNTGQLQFIGGDTGSTTGDFNVAAGAQLIFGPGDFTFAASSDLVAAGILDFHGGTQHINGTVSGTGIVRFDAGTQDINGSFTAPDVRVAGADTTFNIPLSVTVLELSNGTLSSASTINVSGLFTWLNGTLSGGGTTNANGGIAFEGGSPILTGGSILNNPVGQTAAFNNSGIGLSFGGGAVFNNNGTFAAHQSGNFSAAVGGGMFNNAGAFIRDNNTGTFTVNSGVPFSNTGSVDVQVGTLALNSTTTSSGPISVSGGATLSLGGMFTQTAGAITLSSGNLAVGGNTMANLIKGTSGVINLAAAGSLSVVNGFDFSGANFPAPGSNGGSLIINASVYGVGPLNNFDGADSPMVGSPAGGGGTLTVNTLTGNLLVATNLGPPTISATTGIIDTNDPPSGAGGTVNLTSTGGAIATFPSAVIQVSSSDPVGTANRRSSASGGNITLQSGRSTGSAISVTSTSQLLSLLENAAPGPGGLITIQATSLTGNPAITVNGAVQADHGGIDIRNFSDSGQISVNSNAIMADIIKIATLGDNSTLNIGGGSISAVTLLRLYAGSISASNNSTINFNGSVNLTGAQIDIAANTVTIGAGFTVMTSSQAHVYATVRNYDSVSGGNGTGGMFGGAGAASFALIMAPPLGLPGGTGVPPQPGALPDRHPHIREFERTMAAQNRQP